jgi:hypothetical protein
MEHTNYALPLTTRREYDRVMQEKKNEMARQQVYYNNVSR